MPTPTQIRLLQKLQEQIGFLQRSCVAFDAGAEDEALRIATALRVIFHDTNNSTSLMTYLGLEDGRMLSSSRGHGDYRDYLSYRLDPKSSTPVKALPILGDRFRKISLNQWWKHESVFVHNSNKYPRRMVVLSAANKDGGTHVQGELEEYYKFLASGEYAFGITGDFEFDGPPPYEQRVPHYAKNAHLALLRQFAHETLVSAEHFAWLGTKAINKSGL